MFSSGIWNVEIRGKARKMLKKIPAKNAGAILNILKDFQLDPFAGDIEKLEGETNTWRRRVGAYRIFYEVYPETHSVYVYRIKRRGSHTY